MYRPRLKYFKERKRNEFILEIVVGTVDFTLQISHGQAVTANIKKTRFKKTFRVIFVRMTTVDNRGFLADASAAQN
jgi:hypothetical protein